MPGTYAPPAVELPKTSVIVGMPAADSRVRSRNVRPPGMKISFCVGRSAPPDSISEITGSRFATAMSWARNVLRTVHGLLVPPRTVGSLAEITHSVPSTTPMPVTTLPPTANSVPQAASGDSSRNGEPGSSSSSIRSRTSSLPRPRCRSVYLGPPPAIALACSAAISSSLASMAALFAAKSADWSSIAERSTVTGQAYERPAADPMAAPAPGYGAAPPPGSRAAGQPRVPNSSGGRSSSRATRARPC